MKKRILALLLAGLLTTSLISCITTKPRPNPGLNEGTETHQTMEDSETDSTVTVTWVEADKTVYVTSASITLTKTDGSNTSIKVNQLTELHCIKISSDAKRCIVEKDGVQYYASADNLTSEDLLGKTFTACNPSKTMYAKSAVNVRKYASDNGKYSSVIKTLAINDPVTVVAQGKNWSKIKYDEENYYFVYSEFLSDVIVEDPDNGNYSEYFTDCSPTLKMYVTATSLNVRKKPNFNASIVANLAMNAEVTVLAQGTIDDTKWFMILVPDDIEEGQTQTYSIGYATAKYLSESKGTLDDMLAQYPTFTKKTEPQTLYVSSDALFVRSTPSFPTANDNIVATLQKKQAVKVVATGAAENNNWAMIELDGKYCFVGYSMLTTDENGNPMPLTFEELLAKYSFTECTEKTVYAKGTVKCNTSPSNQNEPSKSLQAGDAVKVLATGTVSYTDWYLFQIDGDNTFYFAGASLFTDTAPAQ